MRAKFLLMVPALSLGFLTACGGAAAIADLEQLKNKTCECGDDADCVEEAKTMARDWAEKHKNARGGDKDKLNTLMQEMTECNPMVVLELAAAAGG